MQEYFFQLVEDLTGRLRGSQVLLANYEGEESDFVRFNRSRIRQAGSVSQRYVSVELVDGQRHARSTITLTGEAGADLEQLQQALERLDSDLPNLPEDPYLLYSTEVSNTQQIGQSVLPEADEAVREVLEAGEGRDLVGIYSAGAMDRGFANSLGQRNWFTAHSFHLDWCFYRQVDKAVKTSYADFRWDDEAFSRKVALAGEQLETLAGEPKTIKPGGYRVYLAPPALNELFGLLAWGGFGLKDHRTRNTSLLKMIEKDATLAETVTLRENTREGLAPNFESSGFLKPNAVTLIDHGKLSQTLVSPRSAKEYGVETNGASTGEFPASLDMDAGEIPAEEAPSRLDTGVYVNTLWYLNYSDRPAGRITGMTRFATFWVEGGRIVAPLNVMRFDETIYRAMGENLLGLTAQRDFLPSSETYQSRSTDSARLPGALIEDFQLTL